MAQTLLLADDSITMRRVVELTFAEQGVEVVSVSDGQEAIDYISSQRPALALIAATLPKVNGFDVARFVRDHVESRVPVLLLAGAFDNLDEARVRESGASGVLVKPFEPSVVIKRVKELLKMKPETAEPVPPADSGSGRFVTTSEGPVRETTPQGARRAGAGAGMDETPGQGGDYLAQLDAAFESLDAQLAAKSAPAERTASPLDPPNPAAALGAHAPPTPPHETATASTAGDASRSSSSSASPAGALKPVFEVDDNWFEKKPMGDSPVSSAPADALTDRSWLPSAVREETEAASNGKAHAAPDASILVAAAASPPQSGKSVTDPFATLWKEAGQPQPQSRDGADGPLHLSAESIEAFASQVTERVAARIESRIGDELMARVVNDLAPRVSEEVGARVLNDLSTRLSASLLDGLSSALGDRLSAGLAERVAERAVAGALGDSLRQTVHDIAERVVRAEVERIKAAAESRRADAARP